MTEDDARLKRCCGPSDCGHESEIGPGGPGRYCIASACMAWRTAQIGRVREGDEYQTYSTVGHCGLAGAPQ